MSACVRSEKGGGDGSSGKSLQPSQVFQRVGLSWVFGQTKHTLANLTIGHHGHDSELWSQHWALRFLLCRILENAPLFGGTLQLCFPIEKWGDYYGWEERWTAAKIMPPPPRAVSELAWPMYSYTTKETRKGAGGQAGRQRDPLLLSFWPNCSFQLKGENVSSNCEHFVARQPRMKRIHLLPVPPPPSKDFALFRASSE